MHRIKTNLLRLTFYTTVTIYTVKPPSPRIFFESGLGLGLTAEGSSLAGYKTFMMPPLAGIMITFRGGGPDWLKS